MLIRQDLWYETDWFDLVSVVFILIVFCIVQPHCQVRCYSFWKWDHPAGFFELRFLITSSEMSPNLWVMLLHNLVCYYQCSGDTAVTIFTIWPNVTVKCLHTSVIFGRPWVEFLGQRPAVPTEVFFTFLGSHQACLGMLPQTRLWLLSANCHQSISFSEHLVMNSSIF